MDHPDYLDAVKHARNCDQIQGTNQFKLARSLKFLKSVLRNLNKTHFSGITQRVKEQAAKVSDLQRQLLSQPSAATARLEHAERAKWHVLIKAEEKFYSQKSRVQWHHLGDRDTNFYHRTVVQRANRNQIHYLRDSADNLIGSSEAIKSHSEEYFRNIFGSTDMPISPCSVQHVIF